MAADIKTPLRREFAPGLLGGYLFLVRGGQISTFDSGKLSSAKFSIVAWHRRTPARTRIVVWPSC